MDENRISDILDRGVGQFTDPEGRLERFLRAPKTERPRFVVKFGVDPTRPDIHLGHAVVLHKLRALQEAGALVVFLIGDFTAMIGDPTGKSKVRPEISQQEVEKNMRTYLDQVGKILSLDPKVFSWIRNSDWFASPTDIVPGESTKVEIEVSHEGKPIKALLDPNSFEGKAALFHATRMQATHLHSAITHNVSLVNFLAVLRRITHSRLIQRDMFQERITSQSELYLHEMMYPVLQAIDSHVIARVYGSCDMEIGGSDQTFNMLMGRDVMHMTGQPPQAVMAMELIEGTDGKEKMSKSLDNYISIGESPTEIYGKSMSIPDSLIVRYARLATYTTKDEIDRMERTLQEGKVNPMDLKMSVARQIVAIYHGEAKADEAEREFIETFRKGALPSDIPEFVADKGDLLVDVLMRNGVVASKTQYKQFVADGAIEVHGKGRVKDSTYAVAEDIVVRVGKKTFVRLRVS